MDKPSNDIRIRIRDKELFVDCNFKRITIGQGISALVGKLKANANGKLKVHVYIFEAGKWEVEDAKKWTTDNAKSADYFMGENAIFNLSEEGQGAAPVEPIRKGFDCEIKSINEEERSLTAIASTESVDRDGDVIRASGWKLKNFKKNPVFLWQHNSSILPLGSAKDAWIENDKLMFTPVFATAEMNPFAEQVFRLYQAKHLRSFSVRFDPLKWNEIKPEEGKGSAGLMVRSGREFTSQELLEVSAVNVPANPEAITSKEMVQFAVKSYIAENANRFADQETVKELLKKDFLESSDEAVKAVVESTPAAAADQGIAHAGAKTLEERRAELEKLKAERAVIEKLSQEEKELLEIDQEIKQIRGEIEAFRAAEDVENKLKEIRAAINGMNK
jgi:phage head maturation protease